MSSAGLLGGAFDPPHAGHVALARAAKEQLGLERLTILVSVEPGHKRTYLPAEERLELARAAFPDDDVRLDPYPRTVDLLRAEHFDDPVFVIGADEFCDFGSWKEPDEVLERVRLAVGTRPGYPQERLDAALEQLDSPERVLFFELEPNPAASREIRRRAAAGQPLQGLVPDAVAERIRDRGLYGGG
jgi:nicotinate-nucleotide adenylyltransferase